MGNRGENHEGRNQRFGANSRVQMAKGYRHLLILRGLHGTDEARGKERLERLEHVAIFQTGHSAIEGLGQHIDIRRGVGRICGLHEITDGGVLVPPELLWAWKHEAGGTEEQQGPPGHTIEQAVAFVGENGLPEVRGRIDYV